MGSGWLCTLQSRNRVIVHFIFEVEEPPSNPEIGMTDSKVMTVIKFEVK
jgi:hypothetical protein